LYVEEKLPIVIRKIEIRFPLFCTCPAGVYLVNESGNLHVIKDEIRTEGSLCLKIELQNTL